MSDWIRKTEHVAAIQQRDRTIRSLQAQLRELRGVSRLIPEQYASELVAAYEIAYGKAPNGDAIGGGKPGSQPPPHNPLAAGLVRRELAMLERRAARNAATSAGEGALAKAVDHLEAP